jgi:hypothetical protein
MKSSGPYLDAGRKAREQNRLVLVAAPLAERPGDSNRRTNSTNVPRCANEILKVIFCYRKAATLPFPALFDNEPASAFRSGERRQEMP